MVMFEIYFFETRSCLGAELKVFLLSNMIVFGRFRAPCCFQTWSCLGPFGAARGVVFWRVFWGRSGGRFLVRFLAPVGVAFLVRFCGGAAAGVAPVRCAASFFRRGLVRWGGAVRGVRAGALRGCASRPVCARPGRSWRRVCFFYCGFFWCAVRWRAAVAGAARAAFFFLRARGVPAGRFLV